MKKFVKSEAKSNGISFKMKSKELKKFFVRRIAALSDLHVMSRYAIFPPEWTTSQGNVLTPNAGQRQIYESYQNFCNVCDEWEIDTVLLGGDLVHGQNPIERGIGLMSTDLGEQVAVTKEVLRPLLKGRKSHWVSGSGYHNSARGMSIEETICEEMKNKDGIDAHWYGSIANLKVSPFEKIINLSHGGGRASYYRETLIAREIIFGKVAYANQKLPKIDIYVHGHFHWWNHLHQQGVHHIQTPAWTAYEPIALFTPSYPRLQPETGGVLLLFDDEGRVTVWPFLYPTPHISDSVRMI